MEPESAVQKAEMTSTGARGLDQTIILQTDPGPIHSLVGTQSRPDVWLCSKDGGHAPNTYRHTITLNENNF